MKKNILIIFVLGILQFSFAQQDSTFTKVKESKTSKPLSSKIYYGGNIGMSFGTYTMVGIYPLMGYKFTPKFSGGVKLAYEYIQDKRYASTFTTSNYGASVFMRYRILKPVYLHAEYAGLNYELFNPLGESNREWIPFLLLGAGYSQAIGNNVWLNAQVLFDVLQSDKSPYNDWEPFYSIGVSAGF